MSYVFPYNSVVAIEYIRRGYNVRRYHQYSLIQEDTVGKHSAGVGVFIIMVDPECDKRMLEYALLHDVAEVSTGDIPADAKRALSKEARRELADFEASALDAAGVVLPDLSPEEHLLFKLCDYFDGLTFCIEEATRGNRTLRKVGDTYLKYLPEYFNNIPRDIRWFARAQFLFNRISSQWMAIRER